MSSNSDDNILDSGTYVIHSVQDSRDDERLIMITYPKHDDKVRTRKDQMFKWIVTYYKDDENYTIKAADTDKDLYVITKKVTTKNHVSNDVYTDDTSQRFKISPVTYQNTVYYEIIATDSSGSSGVFQCDGDKRQVEVVPIPKEPVPSILWDFEECSPYTRSDETDKYFESDPKGKLLPRFGLTMTYTWDELWKGIDALNKEAQGGSFYKLFLLGRHGHNEHNIKKQLKKDYDGFDAALTQIGYVQAGLVRAVWDSARSENLGIGLPQLSFCSPMRRALATNSISFSSDLSVEDPPTPNMNTLVVENCRERMYTDDSEKRHTSLWIDEMFPNFNIESGFTKDDKLWNPNLEESFPHFRARGRDILDRVFAPENVSVKFVSITAHHEWSAMIMEVLGLPGTMDNFKLEEGGVLPIIVKYTLPAN